MFVTDVLHQYSLPYVVSLHVKVSLFSPYFSPHAHTETAISECWLQFWQSHLIQQPRLLITVIRVKNFDDRKPFTAVFHHFFLRMRINDVTSIRKSTQFKPFWVKIGWEVWPPGRLGKNKESHKHRIFHIFTQKPPLLRSSPNLVWGQISRTKSTVPNFVKIRSAVSILYRVHFFAFPIGMTEWRVAVNTGLELPFSLWFPLTTTVWQNLAFCVMYKYWLCINTVYQNWNRVTGHRVSDGRVGSQVHAIYIYTWCSVLYSAWSGRVTGQFAVYM